MKNLKILTLAAGMLSPVFVSGQTFQVEDVTNGIFWDLVVGMEGDSGTLFVPEGSGPYTEIAYTPSFPIPSDGTWETGDPIASPGPLYFKEISPNENHFFLAASDESFNSGFDIGYFGNESGDTNRLYLAGDPGKTDPVDLFIYDAAAGGEDPPAARRVTNLTDEVVKYKFWHDDETKNIDKDQGEELKFKMFQGYDPLDDEFIEGEFVFAIGDRAAGFDKDFDDGFFYISGDISPVPEPSQIALLGLLGLGGLLYFRRRRVIRK